MTRLVRMNTEGVSKGDAVVLECTLAMDCSAEVRNQTFTKFPGQDK